MPVTHRIQRQKKSKVTKQQRKVNKKCKSCKQKGGYNQPYAVQFHPQHAQHAQHAQHTQNQQQYNLFATQLQQAFSQTKRTSPGAPTELLRKR